MLEEKFVRPAMSGDLQARSQAIPAKAIWSHLASQSAYRLSFPIPKSCRAPSVTAQALIIKICIFIWQKNRTTATRRVNRESGVKPSGRSYLFSVLTLFLALRSFQGVGGGGRDCRRVTPIWRLIWYLVFITNGNKIDFGTFEGVGEDKGHTPFSLSFLPSWLTQAPETVIYCQV